MGRVALTPPTLWPKRLSSASCATGYAPSGTGETAMATHSMHIPSAADAQLPPQLVVGRGYMVVHDAWWSAKAAASAATPALLDRSRLAHRPCRLPLAPPPHSFLGKSQVASVPPDADS